MTRNCVACGQRDDHPRHVVVVSPTEDANFHLDCHAAMDPPCESCAHQTRNQGKARGDDFREILTTQDQES